MDTVEVLKMFENESKEFKLNNSGSKTLKISVQSIYPSLKLVFELRAIEHRCSVKFGKASWDAIIDSAENITQALRTNDETEFFKNKELTVFSEEMHDSCAICFVDPQEVRVNMMRKTFREMVESSSSIRSEYQMLSRKMKETAKNLKKVVDVIVVASNQPNPGQMNTYIANFYQHINDQCKILEGSLPKTTSVDLYFEEDDIEDFIERRTRRRRFW